jgi:peptide deformylase
MRLRLTGWTARIFQHEIDHLNGILYIDKLTAKENLWTEEEFQAMQEAVDEEEAVAQ